MARRQTKQADDPVLEELERIRNLLILTLYGVGFPSSEIANPIATIEQMTNLIFSGLAVAETKTNYVFICQ